MELYGCYYADYLINADQEISDDLFKSYILGRNKKLILSLGLLSWRQMITVFAFIFIMLYVCVKCFGRISKY